MPHWILLCSVALAIGLSGCLEGFGLAKDDPEPCARETVAPDGTVIPPGEQYWTLTTDQIPIPEAKERVDAIPAAAFQVDGVTVETVTRSAVVDGEDLTERRWACRLATLEETQVQEGSQITMTAQSSQADHTRLAFHYRHPDGREIGYEADPSWEADGPGFSHTLPEIQPGFHDAYGTVHYPNGSTRTHHFVVEFVAD